MFNQDYNNCINNNNKKIVSIPIERLLGEKIIIPNEQRIRDDDKVNEIIKYQDNYYKSGHNHFNFIGCINIHCCIEDGKNYLVDGQHRFKAMEKLHKEENYKNFNVQVEIVRVSNKNELIENYKIINKNTELPEFQKILTKIWSKMYANTFFNSS